MKNLIEQAKTNPKSLNDGEKALVTAAITAEFEGIKFPIFGVRLGDVVWDKSVAEIVEAAKKWNIDTVLYASGQTDSVNTLGLFSEAGAAVATMQKLTLNSKTLAMVDGEMKEIQKTVWAIEIKII
jgi:hypothetical protein